MGVLHRRGVHKEHKIEVLREQKIGKLRMRLTTYQRTYFFAGYNPAEVTFAVHIEHDNR